MATCLEMDIPKNNFIGELQVACQQARSPLPEYSVPTDSNDKLFKCTCTLNHWVSHGTGNTKMFAKQNAAKEMLKLIDNGKLLSSTPKKESSRGKSSVSKLHIYCSKEKKNSPLFSDLPQVGELFCIKCTMDDFSAIGKGNSKKEARENAAFEVAEHFNVHKYYDDLTKSNEEKNTILTAAEKLNIFCQKNHLGPPTYDEDEIKENNSIRYHVTCSVGDLKQESWAYAKKAARHEAAALLLQALNGITPENSPCKTEQKKENDDEDNGTKRKSDLSDDLSSPSKLGKFED